MISRLLKVCFLGLPFLLLLAHGTSSAAPKRSVAKFYAQAQSTIATVEYVQEYLAGGQKQQTRAYTDGVVISEDGLVLISGKVRFPQRGASGRLSSGSRPEISGFRLHFSDGRSHSAEVVAFEDDLNLGVLRITDLKGEQIPHITFREGFRPAVGQGLRSLTLYSAEYNRTPVLAPISINALLPTPQDVWSLSGAGASLLGAPLWDGRGRVVGVIAEVPMSPWAGRQVTPRLSGAVGLSYERFAPWLQEVRMQLQAAEADNSAATAADEPSAANTERSNTQGPPEPRAWIGVSFEALKEELRAHLGISEGGGVIVTRVVPSSPAEAAGLQPLDILTELAGERIAATQEADSVQFAQKIRTFAPGSELVLTRERPGGDREQITLRAGETPTSNLHAERRSDENFELTVREVTLDTLLGMRLPPSTTGVVVDGLTGAGWAGLAGLRVGLLIQRIGEQDVVDLASFEAALSSLKEERPSQVMFFARAGRTTHFFVAEPDWTELEDER